MNINVVLHDLLLHGLSLVFCGTAVGKTSARVRAYYAGRGNQFWQVLHEVGLAPRLSPERYQELLRYGIGLTDLLKYVAGNDTEIQAGEYDADGLRSKIIAYAPKVLAFNGKKAVMKFFHCRTIDYGWYPEPIGTTRVYVLPSTSGAARAYWKKSYWHELAEYVTERASTP